jgi:hypothetical protein
MNKKKDKEYTVEKIVDRRMVKGKYEYLIKWEDYPESENTWEPLKNLGSIKELVDEYDKEFPKEKTDKTEKTESSEKNEKNEYLNKKRNIDNNNILNENYNGNGKFFNYEGKDIQQVEYDDRFIEVMTIKKVENELIAVVVFQESIESATEKKEIPTRLLAKLNPIVLLQYYESKIKFT